ncbi:hypothetical protein HN51_038298 [Arachis hypogaea]|uniref:Fe2OG dioxygenase domain-containing protein n=1 Tax=Arachis hypogaea TaxID=3818 RepID=A0A444ZSL0_ARAHY|nr:codeine O-demethylase [Arachis hypogaea]QHO03994.1 Codeine O-demethylase [Arachis hypogaea]RYR17175.1 hypothetical protein Ahy_B03g061956 [Arachis hypogaea]
MASPSQPEIAIPEMFIRPELEPTAIQSDHEAAAIPIFDLQTLLSDGNDNTTQLHELYDTCKEWGIFQVRNHGVSREVLENLEVEMEKFFNLSKEEKSKYQVEEGDFQGYGNVKRRSKDEKVDWGERFFMVINPMERRKADLLEKLPPSLRETLETYFAELRKIGMGLLRILGEGVGMEIEEVDHIFDNGMQTTRMTYYPPCPNPELVLGLTPHSDSTGITILHQVNAIEGLQIKKHGLWLPVSFHPNAFLVLVGDIFEIVSNGVYNSMEHRVVVNKEKGRLSIAMFMNPKYEAEIGPAKSLISEENPPLFRRMVMEDFVKDYFSRKLNGKAHLDNMRIKTTSPPDDH